MRFLFGMLSVLVLGACGVQEKHEATRLSAEEKEQMKLFASDQGKSLGLIVYDEDNKVIAKDIAFPTAMAKATVCLQEGDGELATVRVHRSCCDKEGTEVQPEKINNRCWSLQPVSCRNERYSLVMNFGDGDVAHYENAKYFTR